MSAVYEIFSVSSDDEGSYTCQATNAVGIAEERIHIRIEDDEDDSPPCSGDRGDIPCAPDDQHPLPPDTVCSLIFFSVFQCVRVAILKREDMFKENVI